MAGRVEWDQLFPPTNIRIKVDGNRADHVNYVIHELLHVILLPIIIGQLDDTLEEVVVCSLDTYMYQYVKKSPKRFALWNDTINQKLTEGKPDTPLETLVDRS